MRQVRVWSSPATYCQAAKDPLTGAVIRVILNPNRQ